MQDSAMTDTVQSEGAGVKPGKPGPERIIRWGSRITSIPVLALVLTSLLPALASFSVSASDDKLIAIGLCVTFAGLITAWKYARVGGAIVLAGVILMLSQGDNLLYPDPFSLAFGLQGILFVLAGTWVAGEPTGTARLAWGKKGATALLCILAGAGIIAILRGPGPTPVPKENAVFVGAWSSASGLTLEVDPEGLVKVGLPKNSHVEGLSVPVAEGETNTFMAYFHETDSLELNRGWFRPSQTYHIDRRPHTEGKQVRCTLRNVSSQDKASAVTFVKNSGG